MARYEYAEGTSNKFWEVELSDRKVTTTYGRIGVQGRTTVKEFDSPAKAQKAHDKLIAEKTAKGYQLVEEAGASARAAEPGAAAKPARAKRSATKSAGPQAPELVPTRPPPPTSERLPSPVSYGVPINATNAAGRRDGVWQMKLRDDEKTHELRFDNGYLAGLCRVFDGDGRLVGETHYRPRPDVYDQPTGPFCFSGWTMPGGASRSMRGGSSSQGTSYSYHANGAVAWQSPHDAEGVLDGFQRGWDKEGNLLAEKPYKGGLLDGWSYERQDDGSYKAQQWERGRLLLSEKQEERVINKIRKARDSYKKMDALEDFVPFDGRYPLLWHLVGTGKYPVAEDPELWGVLDDGRGYATAEQILTVVKAITKVDDNKVTTVIRGWPCSIDTMLQHVWFDLSPEQRESLAREVAPALRPGLLQLRARLGGSISDKDRKTILGLLADKEIFDYPCLDSVRLADENGQLTDEVRTPELRERYLRLFGSEEDWGRAILKRALKKGDSLAPERIRPGLLLADRSELARLLKEISCMANHEYSKVLEGRHDSPEDLLRVAQAIKPEGEWVHGGVDSMAEACFIEAARRCQETGQPLPEDLDRFIECKTYDHDCHADPPLRGLEPLRRALQVLPRPRLAAVLSRLLDNKYLFAQAGFALAVLDEPALLDKLVSCLAQVAADEKDIGQYRSRAFLAGQAGSWALPALEKALAASSNERERAIFWRTTVAAAAAMARAGEPIPERLDELVDWHQAVDQYDADWFWSHACRQILRGLPEKRAEAILLRALDAKQRHWTVPFTAFEICYTEAVAEKFAKVLAEATPRLPAHPDGALKRALDRLGERARPALASALKASNQAPALVTMLKNALSSPDFEALLGSAGIEGVQEESLVEKVARLAGGLPGDRVSIYLLERCEEEAGDGDISRSGGPPFGITDRSWPKHGSEHQDHVLTLDLDEMPDLKERRGLEEYRALVLFVPEKDTAHDITDGKVVLLKPEEVEAGAYRGDKVKKDEVAHRIRISRVEVPTAVFVEPDEELDDQRGQLKTLKNAVFNAPGHALGLPFWIQEEEETGGQFLFQFSEGLSYMNLGDSGTLYVFDDGVVFQCY